MCLYIYTSHAFVYTQTHKHSQQTDLLKPLRRFNIVSSWFCAILQNYIYLETIFTFYT